MFPWSKKGCSYAHGNNMFKIQALLASWGQQEVRILGMVHTCYPAFRRCKDKTTELQPELQNKNVALQKLTKLKIQV